MQCNKTVIDPPRYVCVSGWIDWLRRGGKRARATRHLGARRGLGAGIGAGP